MKGIAFAFFTLPVPEVDVAAARRPESDHERPAPKEAERAEEARSERPTTPPPVAH